MYATNLRYCLTAVRCYNNTSVWFFALAVGRNSVISLQSGINEIRINVTAQNGTVREYVIHVVRQAQGPTYTQGAGGTVPETSASGSAGSSSQSSGGQSSSQDLLTGPGMGM